MMSWILILSLVSSIGLLVAQNSIYDINTQVQSMDISIRHPRFYAIGVFADLISDVIYTNLHDNKQILGWQ